MRMIDYVLCWNAFRLTHPRIAPADFPPDSNLAVQRPLDFLTIYICNFARRCPRGYVASLGRVWQCRFVVVTATITPSRASACAHTAGWANSVRRTPSQPAGTRLALLWPARHGRSRCRAPAFVSASPPGRSRRTCESLGAHRCAPGVALMCPGSSIKRAKCSVPLTPPSTHSVALRSRPTTGGTGNTSRGPASTAAPDVARASAARASARRLTTGPAALTGLGTKRGRRRYRPRGCGCSCTTCPH